MSITAAAITDLSGLATSPVPSLPEGSADLGEQLRSFIALAITAAPRSAQTRIGPSEVGIPCQRRLAHKLAHTPEVNARGPAWRPTVGVGVHEWLAERFSELNELWPHPRFWPEQPVNVGRVGDPAPGDGFDLTGTCDLYDRWREAVIDWKGIHVDTPVATPDGWTTVGQLHVGDEVFGSNGQPCHVTQTYPVQQRDCYRVCFTDGTHLITDDVQELPFVIAERTKLVSRTMSVGDAITQVWSTAARPQRQLRLYNGAALELPDCELVVHPYVLGCWLGDGTTAGGTISKPDGELFERIEACGYRVSAPHGTGQQLTRTVHGLSTQLQQIGLQWVHPEHGHKHHRLAGWKTIPARYLRGSRHQRLSLLQGLMDTDGTWNRVRHQAVFTTTNKELAESTAELITTLGWKAKIYTHPARGFGLTTTAHDVTFVPFGSNPFRLSRKANLVRLAGTTRAQYRLVQSIEPTLSLPTRCIDVDSADHLYRCGEQMIPVHNCVGPTTLRTVRAHGPEPTYQVQAQCYGRGWVRRGMPVRTVAIMYLPSNGELTDAVCWQEPYDEQVALDALARVSATWALTRRFGSAVAAAMPTADAHCQHCPWWDPGASDLTRACPGHPDRDIRPDRLFDLIAPSKGARA